MTVFISHAVGEERIGFGPFDGKAPAGRERWKRLAALYRESFVECGMAIEDVVRPEIYQAEIARTILGVAVGDWHIAVKPHSHLRPFHGIPNAFVFDGDDRDCGSRMDESSPFSDPKIVLGRADAVLCTTETSAASLLATGIESAIFLPPHLPMPAIPADPRSCHAAAGGPVRFGTFLDQDASLDALSEVVHGFAEARTRNAGLHLVVVASLQVPPSGVTEWVARGFGNETARAVSCISLNSDEACTDHRMKTIDYTLSIDPKDRLSIGLAQAMRQGIPSVRGGDVAAAILEAAAANAHCWQEMSERARRDAESKFGLDAFRGRVADLQRQLGGRSS